MGKRIVFFRPPVFNLFGVGVPEPGEFLWGGAKEFKNKLFLAEEKGFALITEPNFL